MKLWMLPVMVFVCFVLLVAKVYGINLVKNSSFECGLDEGYGYIGTFSMDKNEKYHGEVSLRIDSPAFQVVSDDIKLEAGKTYNYSLWMKSSVDGAKIKMRLLNSQSKPWNNFVITVSPTNRWKQYKTTLTVPTGNQYYRIWLENSTSLSGTVWIDAIEVEEIGDNAYTAPEFEIGVEKVPSKYYTTSLTEIYPIKFHVCNNTSKYLF